MSRRHLTRRKRSSRRSRRRTNRPPGKTRRLRGRRRKSCKPRCRTSHRRTRPRPRHPPAGHRRAVTPRRPNPRRPTGSNRPTPRPSYPAQPSRYPAPSPYQSGYPSAPYAGGYGAPKTNGMAIGSLVASIIGVPLFFACFTGAIAAMVGIVLGVIALNQIKQSGEQGRGFAIAGIVIGGIVLALNLLFIILYLVTKSYSYT